MLLVLPVAPDPMAGKLVGGTTAHSGLGVAPGRASLCHQSARSAVECGAGNGHGARNIRTDVPSAATLKEVSNVAISELTGYWEPPQAPVTKKLRVAVDVDEGNEAMGNCMQDELVCFSSDSFC